MTNLVSCCSPSAFHIWPDGADRGRHRRVDDHVARDVQVGDAAVGVDHRQRRAVLVGGGDRLGPASRSPSGRRSSAVSSAARPSLAFDVRGGERVAVLAEHDGKNARTAWPKMIGSETFIIVALRCTENSTPCALAVGDLRREERVERRRAHDRRVEHLAGQHGHRRLEHASRSPSAATCSIRTSPSSADRHRQLGRAEVAVGHRRDVRASSPRDHAPIECGCLRA